MIIRTIATPRVKRSLIVVVLGLFLIGLVNCASSPREEDIEPVEDLQVPAETTVEVAEAQAEPPIEPPIEATQEVSQPSSFEPAEASTESTNETPAEAVEVSAPIDQQSLPEVRLPPSAVERLNKVAEDNGLNLPLLAVENTVIYALPADDGGIVFLLTPTVDSLGFSTKELAIDPARFANRVLGGLTVIRQVNEFLPALPPGDYIITLSPDASKIIFTTGIGVTFEFDAVIRALPRRLPRPTALITSSQMCLAWDVTQACALVNSPLPDNWVNRIREAIGALQEAEVLQAGEDVFALARSIPDIEGVQGLQRCAIALSGASASDSQTPEQVPGQAPDYAACWATVLAVPAIADGPFPLPPGTLVTPDRSTGIGLLVGLETIEEEVFLDPELTQPATDPDRPNIPFLAPDNYLTFEVRLDGDPEIDKGIFERRVLQLSPSRERYLPTISGATIVGIPMRGSGPSNEEEAIIVNLWVRKRCIFKWRQCPEY